MIHFSISVIDILIAFLTAKHLSNKSFKKIMSYCLGKFGLLNRGYPSRVPFICTFPMLYIGRYPAGINIS